MKVVLDTNVVVSAVLRDRDPEAIIRFIASQQEWLWYASPEVLAEYSEVLRRPKFGLPPNIIQSWDDIFAELIHGVDVNLNIDFPRDQKDAKFLTCALTIDADYFVTGDHDFSEAYKLVNTTICSVRQFKQLIIDTSSPLP